MFKKWITFSGILLFVTTLGLLSYNINAAEAQTGTGCTNGTDNCENNNLTTVNSTTTTNTNTNTSTATNTNNNTNTNANTNVNTTTTTATNTANNTNVNTNANTNVNTSTATSTATSNNTNTNANTNVNTSTSTNTSNVTQAVTNNTTSNNTSSNTSTSANTNTNVNNSTSESNVTTDNTNTNNNNINANNTNTNVNQSSSTQVIEQRVKSPPASAIAPSIMSYSQDLCTTGRSGALQGQLFGFSGGTTVRDMNCERLKLSKYLYDMGMKVASVSLLCQDNRVFQAMEMAGTPCPNFGKIGKEATVAWQENPEDRPDYEDYKVKTDAKALAIKNEKKRIDKEKLNTFMKKCWLSPNKKGVSKSKRTCKKEWKKQNGTS
jgi:hypothetical protein